MQSKLLVRVSIRAEHVSMDSHTKDKQPRGNEESTQQTRLHTILRRDNPEPDFGHMWITDVDEKETVERTANKQSDEDGQEGETKFAEVEVVDFDVHERERFASMC